MVLRTLIPKGRKKKMNRRTTLTQAKERMKEEG